MLLFKQKTVWLGLLVVFAVLSVFGLAMMGSIVGAKPKELPVAIVVLDQPAKLPNGTTLAVGDMIKEKLLANEQLPIRWITESSDAAVREGLNQQTYYGALVLPADLSSGLLTLQTSSPKPATVQILVNEGMSAQASTAVSQLLQQVMHGIGPGLSQQLLGMIGQQTQQVSLQTATALLTPVQTQVQLVHPVGVNQASGNAPGLLTQIIWIGSLVASVFLFLSGNRAVAAGARKFGVVSMQSATGIGFLALISGFIVWMATSWYGMELESSGSVWLFLWLAGSAFFFLQSALLGWIGLPAMGLLVLLMFFSMPLLNMAPEFLPQATQDWLYSWTPLRYVASGLRNVMYFDGEQPLAPNVGVLWGISVVFGLVLLASGFRGVKTGKQPQVAA